MATNAESALSFWNLGFWSRPRPRATSPPPVIQQTASVVEETALVMPAISLAQKNLSV